MANLKLIQTLQGMDIDGIGEEHDSHMHGLFNYPARMHPYVVRSLIHQLSSSADVIYDPYCGSGTVLLESMIQDRYSVGADTNPLATLLTKVKSTPIHPSLLFSAAQAIEKDILRTRSQYQIGSIPFDPSAVNLDYWFKKGTIRQLSTLHHLLNSDWLDFDRDVIDFVQLCFAKLVRQVSTVRKGEFKLYREPGYKLKDYRPDVFSSFLKILRENIRRSDEFYELVRGQKRYVPTIYNERNEMLNISPKADLILTSPPYGDNPTTITYGQYCRYPLLWLGFPKDVVYSIDRFPSLSLSERLAIKQVVEESRTYMKISKRIRTRDSRRALVVEDYFVSLTRSLVRIISCLKTGGILCMVIGSRRVCNVIVPNHKIVEEIGSPLGLKLIYDAERTINSKRMPSRNSNGKTISKETIVILEKA